MLGAVPLLAGERLIIQKQQESTKSRKSTFSFDFAALWFSRRSSNPSGCAVCLWKKCPECHTDWPTPDRTRWNYPSHQAWQTGCVNLSRFCASRGCANRCGNMGATGNVRANSSGVSLLRSNAWCEASEGIANRCSANVTRIRGSLGGSSSSKCSKSSSSSSSSSSSESGKSSSSISSSIAN